MRRRLLQAATVAAPSLALLAATPGAFAQAPALPCTDAAEAVEVVVGPPTPIVGGPVTVGVAPRSGRAAPVAAIVVSATPGLVATPLATPAPGAVSSAGFTVPDAASTTITVTWTQGEEPGVTGSCAGEDRRVVAIGPSAAQLGAFAPRAARAQELWNTRRSLARALVARFDARFSGGVSGGEVFAAIRAAAARALREMRAVRVVSSRYSVRVRRSRPPAGLLPANGRLALTARAQDELLSALFTRLSRATTLADIVRARRELAQSAGVWNTARTAWRKELTAAYAAANARPPRWIARVGRRGR